LKVIERKDWLFGLILVIVTLAAYQPAWHGQRVWDDDGHLTRPELRSLEGLARIWTQVGATQQYYPLAFSAFWLEHKLWGDATLGYHLVNILLHGVSALLFLIILRRLEVPGAYLAAAIFAVHPVQVESVAWMSQLKNTLSCVLYLGSALAYLGFDHGRRKRSYALALALFAMGLMSKTAVATLPAGLLVVFWWKRGRLSWKSDVLPLVPFFAAAIMAGLGTVWLERNLYGAKGGEFQFSLVERCLIAGRAVWFHLGKLFWPVNLLFMYPRWQINAAVWWQYLYPAAAVGLVAGLLAVRKHNRGPLAALLLFGGTLFPTLGFFNACTFRYSFVNDHHQYLASLPIIALVSAGVALAGRRWVVCERLDCRWLGLPLIAALAVLSWRQCRMYADVDTLWRTTLAGNPGCYLGWQNLGNVLLNRGQTDEAIGHFRKALAIRPDYAESQNDLGLALMQKGQVKEAIGHFQKALESRSDLPEGHINLGNALAQEGQWEEAISHYQWALGARPSDGRIYSNIGHALFQQGKLDDAVQYLQRAVELAPTHAAAQDTLGLVRVHKGQAEDAIPHFRAALQVQPDFAEALNNLAWILAAHPRPDLRNGPEAVELAKRACKLTNDKQAMVVGTLAAAYAEAGRFAEAVTTAEKAAALADQDGQTELAARNRKLAEQYRAGKPAREAPGTAQSE
jgi:protein O-mannosyl-transferase